MNTHSHINGLHQPPPVHAHDHPSLVAYFFVDNQGIVKDFDDQTAQILNIPEQAFNGLNLVEFAGDDAFAASLKSALAGAAVYHRGQISIVGKQPKKNFAVYLRPIFLENKALAGVAGFVHYARPGVVSPFEMGQQVEYFNLIAKNSSDLISLHSFEGKLLFLSPSFEKLTGIPYERFANENWQWLIHPDDRQLVLSTIEAMKHDPSTKVLEYRYIMPDNQTGWVESTFQVIDSHNLPQSIAAISRDITARKTIEKALQVSESKYHNLMLSLPTGVALTDLNGKIFEANEAFFNIIDEPSHDINKLPTITEFDEKYNSDIGNYFNKCLETGKLVEGQQVYTDKTGKRKNILFSMVPLTDESGRIFSILGNLSDHTNLVAAEEESRKQADFMNMVINTLQEPFFVKDENHTWVMLNDANIAMIGYPREFLIGKSDYDIFPKEQADIFWEMDNQVLQNGANINEEQITWSTGEVRTVITSKYLYTDRQSGKKFIVGSIHEISNLKRIQETLRESEQKYHDLFQNANDLIFTTDLRGNFTDANQRVLDVLGIPLRKLLRSSVFEYVNNVGRERFRQILEQMVAHKSISALEVETRAADGSTVILEVHGRLMFIDNKPYGIQGIARDISEKTRYNQQLNLYNEELRELNKSKDKMFSIIAHDLKDPFNSLLGFSEILLDDFDRLDRSEMRDYVKIIHSTAKHSLNLLENLLTWSRLLTGRLPFAPVKLCLATEVETAMTIVSSLAYRKRIALNNIVPQDLMIRADQNMLLSILHNFIMNAIKFTNPGGRVIVDARAEENTGDKIPMMLITVNDNGIGMDAAGLDKLFKINAIYSTAGTQNEKGTGLGLLLTREMIEKHGGSVHVLSEPAVGTTFSFTLPAG